jgi:hypothetical protein
MEIEQKRHDLSDKVKAISPTDKKLKFRLNEDVSLIYYYLFLLLAFLLPFFERAVPLVIILIVMNWLAEGRFRDKFRKCLHDKNSQLVLSFAALYVIYLTSMSYSGDLRQGISELRVGHSHL